ncbi:MAG: putative DNA binding domain-containing protein, partial [Acidobacteria bacterium]|nr:putative DNA binding domain-containing protein [Acidobacteriota bacterium]
YRGRPVEKEEDLAWFVDNAIQETIDLEYKAERYGGNDSQRREFLKDIGAMANANGGLVIIGIRERQNGVAQSIDGVEGDIEGETMGGELRLSHLKGDLEISTMGGGITLTDSDVDERSRRWAAQCCSRT